MNSCDCFIGDIVRPIGFILIDFYILGLPTGIGTMNKVSLSAEFRNLERGLVVHLLEVAMNL